MRLIQLLIIYAITFFVAAIPTLGMSQNIDLDRLLKNSNLTAPAEAEIKVSVHPETYQLGDKIELRVSVKLPDKGFTYAQENKTGARPKFELEEIEGLKELEKSFVADRKPKSVYEAVLKKTALKFYEEVVWSKQFEVLDSKAKLKGLVSIPVCDDQTCQLVEEPFDFALQVSTEESGEVESEDGAFGAEVEEEDGAFGSEVTEAEPETPSLELESFPLKWTEEVKLENEVIATLTAELLPTTDGNSATVKFTAVMTEGWHTYSTDKQENAQRTSFSVKQLHGLVENEAGWLSQDKPEKYEAPFGDQIAQQSIYHDTVSWSTTFARQEGVSESGLSASVRIQFCTNEFCLTPSTYRFKLGALPKQTFIVSKPLPPKSKVQPPLDEAWIDDIVLLEEESVRATSFGMYLIYAFVGGLILNVMPCVLPVLAIKIMSFVKQAGEDRGRVIALNVAYSLGVLFVFMILATLISGASYTWGGLFQKTEFNLVMTCFIFAMALSLLGVFEIPIPGMIGSAGGQQREGLLGAFLTGIFATLLATPCSGPFLGATLAWSASQPPHITYIIFFMLGLGMASPYIVLGAFPGAVRFLPKPGNWMIRLKEVSGFILLATVIFFLSYIEDDFQTPLLVMLLGVGFALWMIGCAPRYQVTRKTFWLNRVTAYSVAAVICFYSYNLGSSKSEVELPWQPFSTADLKQARDEGKTILIDFTADWCVNCKVVEKTALNTAKTSQFVEEHDIVTFEADWTDASPEITRWLEKFESKSIPLTVIFPANRQNNPILIRDVYLQSTLLDKLQHAISIPTSEANLSSSSSAGRSVQ